MRFGLIFFSSRVEPGVEDRYRLLLAASRFADVHGWEGVWVPERHFTAEGCLYPNPAVVQAAVARETSRVRLRAGSVVLPLHHPIRVAEEWSVVDNLSGGRVELSFASGWHPEDFVFSPERYENRRQETLAGIEQVRRLWRGEALTLPGVGGAPVTVRTYPSPLQPELPIWLTAAGSSATFAAAGRLGAGLLTHLFNQELSELGERIALYRRELRAAGHDAACGRVAVMVHAVLGADGAAARRRGEAALTEYLATATHLLEAIARSRGRELAPGWVGPEAAADYAAFWAGRLIATDRVLFGSPEEALARVVQLAACGVDELALQVDFGLPAAEILAALPHLERLRQLAEGLEERPAATSRVARGTKGGLAAARTRCRQGLPVADLHAQLAASGVEVGESFQGLVRLWRGDGEALGEVMGERPGESDEIPAGVLDACLQVSVAALPAGTAEAGRVALPAGLDRFLLHGRLAGRLVSHARLRPGDGRCEALADVTVYASDGAPVAEVEGLRLRLGPPLPAPGAGAAPRDVAAERAGGFYRSEWVELARPPASARAGEAPKWLLVGEGAGLAAVLAARLRAAGRRWRIVGSAGPGAAEALRAESGWEGVAHLAALDGVDPERLAPPAIAAATAALLAGVAAVAQELAPLAAPAPALWLVTRGARAVPSTGAAAGGPDPVQAALWGFVSGIGMELPGVSGLVDLDPSVPARAQAEQLAHELLAAAGEEPGEERLALRGGRRLGERLVPWRAPAGAAPPPLGDGFILVAGGRGELGLRLAVRLARRGARRLALLSRGAAPALESGPGEPPATPEMAGEGSPARASGLLAEMASLGAEVALLAVDVSDPAALEDCVMALTRRGWGPLRGVLQLAGEVRPRLLAAIDEASLTRDLAAKVAGSWALDRLSAEQPVARFVGFSSWAALLPPVGRGLAGYAAGNAFLEALAWRRVAAGRPALVVAWGDFGEVGMRARYLAAGGQALPGEWSFSPDRALAALEGLLGCPAGELPPVVSYLAVDWVQWGRIFPRSAAAPLLARLGAAAGHEGPGEAIDEPGGEEVERHLAEEVACALRLPPARVDRRRSLPALGLDSLLALDLKSRLDRRLGVAVSVGELLGEASLGELAARLARRRRQALPAPGQTPAAARPAAPEGIAAAVDRLSDPEVERLLGHLLAQRERRGGAE